MTYEIQFVGNEYTNSSSRDGHIPCLIVDHISAGTWSSLLDWFANPINKGSSATFGVSKKGQIAQFVPIELMAWANGIDATDIANSDTPIVKQNTGINPNKYSISIEHEGTDGNLTEEQFQATVWLHKYIRDYVKDKWGYEINLTSYDVIGHFQVSPYKPMCPGKLFPWERLYEELGKDEEDMTFTTEQWGELSQTLQKAYEKGLLGNYTYVEKAYNGTLTKLEFDLVQLIINVNRATV